MRDTNISSEFGSDRSFSVNKATVSLQLCLWHVGEMTTKMHDESEGSKRILREESDSWDVERVSRYKHVDDKRDILKTKTKKKTRGIDIVLLIIQRRCQACISVVYQVNLVAFSQFIKYNFLNFISYSYGYRLSHHLSELVF